MHDPNSLVFDLYFPWQFKKEPWEKDPIISVWHRDPESDGTDDSCGWFTPKFTNKQRGEIKKIAEDYEFILGKYGYNMTPIEAIYCIWKTIASRCHNRNELTHREWMECVDLASNPGDNLRYSAEAAKENIRNFEDFVSLVYRCYLRLHRPWWKHPRWHFWHWRLQFHFHKKYE